MWRMCAYYFDGAEYFDYPEIYASVTAEDVEQFIRENVKEEQAFLSAVIFMMKVGTLRQFVRKTCFCRKLEIVRWMNL